jgi:hypothetical protein
MSSSSSSTMFHFGDQGHVGNMGNMHDAYKYTDCTGLPECWRRCMSSVAWQSRNTTITLANDPSFAGACSCAPFDAMLALISPTTAVAAPGSSYYSSVVATQYGEATVQVVYSFPNNESCTGLYYVEAGDPVLGVVAGSAANYMGYYGGGYYGYGIGLWWLMILFVLLFFCLVGGFCTFHGHTRQGRCDQGAPVAVVRTTSDQKNSVTIV